MYWKQHKAMDHHHHHGHVSARWHFLTRVLSHERSLSHHQLLSQVLDLQSIVCTRPIRIPGMFGKKQVFPLPHGGQLHRVESCTPLSTKLCNKIRQPHQCSLHFFLFDDNWMWTDKASWIFWCPVFLTLTRELNHSKRPFGWTSNCHAPKTTVKSWEQLQTLGKNLHFSA